MFKQPIVVSVVITTYNWSLALEKVLVGLSKQDYLPFEIIIADDGSQSDTRQVVETMQNRYKLPIYHIWQPDAGFQAAKIRNKAVAKANGEYLIFIDGDCIPLPSFLRRHISLAEAGRIVVGNRILLNQEITQKVLADKIIPTDLRWIDWLQLKAKKGCNRILPLLFLSKFPRKLQPKKWQGAKTCNLGVWKKDFLIVNGFDESYQGWGHEDSDLVVRLMKLGIKRKEGRFALPVIHLWHHENDRVLQHENFLRLKARLTDEVIKASLGVDQYLTLQNTPRSLLE